MPGSEFIHALADDNRSKTARKGGLGGGVVPFGVGDSALKTIESVLVRTSLRGLLFFPPQD